MSVRDAQRSSAARYPLTTRRYDVIATVARRGEAFADDLTRLHFPDRHTANRTLRKLVSAGYLRRHVYDSTSSHGYSLTRRGEAAALATGLNAMHIHRTRAAVSPDVHRRCGDALWTEFILATRAHPSVQLVAWRNERDLRRAAGSSPPPMIPDAIAHLRLRECDLVLAWEVDLATESVSVIEAKARVTVDTLRAGRAFWGARAGTWRPVLLVPDAARARAASRAIVRAEGGDAWLVAEYPTLRRVGALGRAYGTATEVAGAASSDPVVYRGCIVPDAGGRQ